MTGTTAFLMKDLVLLAVSFYLLRQDVVRVYSAEASTEPHEGTPQKEGLPSGLRLQR